MKKFRVLSLIVILLFAVTLVGCIPTPQQCIHQWKEWEIVEAGNCLTSGLKVRECIKCPERQEEVILKGEHSFVNYVPNEHVHCTDEFTATAICENGCGAEDVKVIGEAPGHDFVEASVVNPTCTETGLISYECHCGETTEEVLKETGHSYNMEETVKVSCTTDGLNTYTCPACGDSYTETVEAPGHDYQVTSQKEVSCTADGETVYECHCGDSYTVVEKATGHKHEVVSMVELSCETDGEVVYECHCGDSYKEVLPSKGHDYHQVDYTPLSCYSNESAWYYCNGCGDVYEEIYQFTTGHKVSQWKLAGEYEVGMCLYEQAYYGQCSECYDHIEKYETIEKHSYTEEVKVAIHATCQSEGIKAYHCICGKVEERSYTNANAHNWVKDEQVLFNTNTAVTYHCANEGCKETKSEIVVEDTKAEVSVENLATSGVQLTTATIKLDEETLSGLSNENITITADVLEGEVLDSVKEKLGEKAELIGDNQIYNFGLSQAGSYIEDEFKGYVTVSVPYDLAEGEDPESIAIWFVDEDGNVETIPAEYSNGTATFQVKHFSYYTVTRLSAAERCALYGHVYTDVVVEPTCTEQGYTIHVCQRCGQSTKDDYVEALGHDTVVDVTPATCLKNGKEVHTCQVEGCGYSYTTVVRATGHNYVSEKVEPTCTEPGLYSHRCANEGCDQAFEEVVPATGHIYEYTDVPATCLEEGLRTYTCACGDTYTEVLEATGHKWEVVEKVNATLETEGYIKYECHCGEEYTKILPILTEEDLTPNLDIISDALASLAGKNMVIVLNDVYIKLYTGSYGSSNSNEVVHCYTELFVRELYLTLDENGVLVGSGLVDTIVFQGTTTEVEVKAYIYDNKAYVQNVMAEGEYLEEQAIVADIVEFISKQSDRAHVDVESIVGILAIAQKWYDESFYEVFESLKEVNEQEFTKLVDAVLGAIFNIEETETGHAISLNIAGLHEVATYLNENTLYDVAELILGSEILENIDLVFDFSVSDLIDFLAERGLEVEDLLASLDDLVVILAEMGMVPEVSTVDELIAMFMGVEEFNVRELIESDDVQNITVGDLVLMVITTANQNQGNESYPEDKPIDKNEVTKPYSEDTMTVEDIKAVVNDAITYLKEVNAYELIANLYGMNADELYVMVDAIITMAEQTVVLETLTNELGEVSYSSITVALNNGQMVVDGKVEFVESYEPAHSNEELKAALENSINAIDLAGNIETILNYLCVKENEYETISYEVITNEEGTVEAVIIARDYFYSYGWYDAKGYREVYTINGEDLNSFVYCLISEECGDWKNYEFAVNAYYEYYDVVYEVIYNENKEASITIVDMYLSESRETVYSLDVYYNAITGQFTSRENCEHNMIENPDRFVEAVGCTEYGHYVYECVNCDYEYVQKYRNGHEYEVVYSELLGKSCEDGVLATYQCRVCQDQYSEEHYWHEESRRVIDLSEYGCSCGGTIEIYSCPCGEFFDTWFNTHCPFDYQEVYYNDWYDYAVLYTCPVTDPACGFKYVEVHSSVKGVNCQVNMVTEFHFGVSNVTYDYETGELVIDGAQYVYVRADKEGYTEHDYVYEVIDSSDTHYHYRDICYNCGSYDECEYYYDQEGRMISGNEISYSALENYRYSIFWECEVINGVQLPKYSGSSSEYPDYAYSNEVYYNYEIIEGVECIAYVQYYSNGRFEYEEVQNACNYAWTSGYIETEHYCTQSSYWHGSTHCQLCGSTSQANVYFEEPRGHCYEWNEDLQTYVCWDCGLENMWGADGEIILEDCSEEESDFYTVGYYIRDEKMEYVLSVTLILNDTEEEIYLDGVYFEYATEGRYVSFSKSQVAELAAEYGFAEDQYRVRLNFVPMHGKEEFDYAITF